MTVLTLADLPGRIRPNAYIDPATGCWRVAPGNGIRLDRDGYARIGVTGVHRMVYLELVGDIPPDRPVLDHVKAWGCEWRDCCFTGHLEPVTVRENTFRGCSPAVANYFKTRCGRCNTPYDLFNTYEYKGRRDCRVCIARRSREYQARLRLAQINPGGAQTHLLAA